MTDATQIQPRSRVRSGALRLAGDDRLARLASKGDPDAFAAIYERHLQPLHRYCQAILGDREDASDCLQNAMLKAFGALQSSPREISLKPWLFRIAHNEAISLLRRRRPTVEANEQTMSTAPGADVDAASRERLARLTADLQELPDRQRGALIMRELDGLAIEEIAEWLGTSAAGARQTIFQARSAMREYAEGREMGHDAVREAIIARDGQRLGSRRMSSHLRDCASCSELAAASRRTPRARDGVAQPDERVS